MSSAVPVGRALRGAVDFLTAAQSRDGLWRDFRTLAGLSSEWVTGFVVDALASSQLGWEESLTARKALVRRQRPNGGWSYNSHVPTDCDSTSWVLIAIGQGRLWRPSMIVRATRFLVEHIVAEQGGFSTYCLRDGIERFTKLPPAMTDGWRTTHPCVTSVAIQSLLLNGMRSTDPIVQRACHYLNDPAEPSGQWRSYWWNGYGYCTYHALRALGMAGSRTPATVRAAHSAVLNDERPDGGWRDDPDGTSAAFATALAVLTLTVCPTSDSLQAARRGVEWLLAHQQPDGSWPTVPILRIPSPPTTDPARVETWRVDEGGTNVVIADQNGIFTTAAALRAIATYAPMATATAR